MIGKFKKLPLEKQLVWSFFLLASFVIALTMTISVFVDIRSERRQIDNTIGNIAEYVASLDSVVDMLEKGYPDPDVQHQMDSLCDAMKNVNVLMICDRNKLRFYHTKRQDWGDSFVDGEEAEALAGQGVYITTGLGTNGEQRRAFCAIKNQNGETQQAMEFIMNSSLVSSQSIREAAAQIRVSKLCALIVGKMMRAAELGIRLTVQPDSICMENDLLLPVQEYVTIVGNLLENAIEELSQKKDPPREIHLGLYCRPDCNVVLCEDTGRGIDPAIRDEIFIKGVSSKGENRGIGLYAIHELVERYHGTIEIESEKNEGTEITLTFTRREEKEV